TISSAVTEELKEGEVALSPGMKYKHYSPKAELYLIDDSQNDFKSIALEKAKSEKCAIMCYDEEIESLDGLTLLPVGKKDDVKDEEDGTAVVAFGEVCQILSGEAVIILGGIGGIVFRLERGGFGGSSIFCGTGGRFTGFVGHIVDNDEPARCRLQQDGGCGNESGKGRDALEFHANLLHLWKIVQIYWIQGEMYLL
ncbi:MAG: hypothetical protein J6C42_09460, partial [Clostridia bacterium]|nr:hypothetical protein [Clostridia bacterium]